MIALCGKVNLCYLATTRSKHLNFKYIYPISYENAKKANVQNGQPKPSVSTYDKPDFNEDGSIDIYFGPKAPEGMEKNWVKTIPGEGWFAYIRLYGPLESYFDKTWKPDDIVKVN